MGRMVAQPETYKTWRINGELYFFFDIDYVAKVVIFLDKNDANPVEVSFSQVGEILAVWMDGSKQKPFWK